MHFTLTEMNQYTTPQETLATKFAQVCRFHPSCGQWFLAGFLSLYDPGVKPNVRQKNLVCSH